MTDNAKQLKIEYHKNCQNCGKFLKRDRWFRKDHPRRAHGLCDKCYSEYDEEF